MATTVMINSARPGLWNSYRHEVFKASRQLFYKLVILVPFVVGLAISALLVMVRMLAQKSLPTPMDNFLSPYDLGQTGSFAFTNNMVLTSLAPLYNLVLIVACSLAVANEYRWNTIKMLATRQPSRMQYVLSKTLLALTLLGGTFLSTIAGWFTVGLVSKFFFDLPFEITSQDLEAMSKGLGFYAIASLQTYVLILIAIVMTLYFKSIVGGIFFYFIYNGIDALISNFGTNVANNGVDGLPEWLRPFAEVVRVANPIMLNSNVNRISMKEQIYSFTEPGKLILNPQIVLSTPIWWSWLILAAYVIGFTGLAILTVLRRDITD